MMPSAIPEPGLAIFADGHGLLQCDGVNEIAVCIIDETARIVFVGARGLFEAA
jgi:hypothetical protein